MSGLDRFFSDGTREYRIPATVKQDEVVTVRLRTPSDLSKAPSVSFNGKEQEMRQTEQTGQYAYYEGSIPVGKEPVRYCFSFSYDGQGYFYGRCGAESEHREEHDFCLTPGYDIPDWAKGAVMYQIYVDRFYNGDTSNDVKTGEYDYLNHSVEHVEWNSPVATLDVGRFYGGDLEGVRKKLDYLQQLGVEVLYLNPIFVSPSNHKYDSQDYDFIDPHFTRIVKEAEGEFADRPAGAYITRTTDPENLAASNRYFAEFVEELHRRGMRIILDGVFNHCGSFHKWMDREGFYEAEGGYEQGAYRSEKSPYREYFRFRDPSDPNSYEGWWGYATLPKLNYEGSEELCEYICQIGAKWVSPPYNVDGWRLDVGADLGHSGEFNHRFWKRFRQAVKQARPDALILAEHYGNPASWLQGGEWDTVMNYDAFMEPLSWFLTGVEKHSDEFDGTRWNNEEHFIWMMKNNMARFQTGSLLCAMNELSNHDHSRFLTRTSQKVGRLQNLGREAAEQGVKPAVMAEAVVFQMLWPGAPTVYYGDEAGLCGFTDPDNRRPFPWGQENAELLFLHREMIRIHRQYPALRDGSFLLLHCEHGILSFGRFDREDQFFVALNNNGEERTVCFSVEGIGITADFLVSLMLTQPGSFLPEARFFPVEQGKITLRMPAMSSFVLKNFNDGTGAH